MKLLVIIIIIAGLMSACKKNELNPEFRGNARIFIGGDSMQGARADSIFYSFANDPQTTVTQEIIVHVRAVGGPVAYNRKISLAADLVRTTALSEEYLIPTDLILPANVITASVPVTIKRSQRLSNETAMLVIKAATSEDFAVDLPKPGLYDELVEFRIVWNDQLMMPEYWPSQWGAYSKVKHQLVIDLSGIAMYSEFMDFVEVYTIATRANIFIEEYNQANPAEPYSNERGEPIRFCATCN